MISNLIHFSDILFRDSLLLTLFYHICCHLMIIVSLQVSSQNGGITYESKDGNIVRCNEHYQQDLEEPIQEKLRQLPMVLKYLMKPRPKCIR